MKQYFKKWLGLTFLLILTAFNPAAQADCLTAMPVKREATRKLMLTYRKMDRIGNGVMIGGLVGNFAGAPFTLWVFLGGFTMRMAPTVLSLFSHQMERIPELTAAILTAKNIPLENIYDSGMMTGSYEEIRRSVQSIDPRITDEQIRNALIIGDREEIICPGGRVMKTKNTARVLVKMIQPEFAEQNPDQLTLD